MPRRFEKVAPDEMTPEQRVIYDAITTGPRAQRPQIFPMTDAEGRFEGPFNAWLINPVFGRALESMGSAYADGMAALNARCRETAILIIAARYECEFEIYAHERVARHNNMSDAEIADLVSGKATVPADPTEALVAETTRQLLANHDLDDAQYARAIDALGLQGVFALVWLTSWYAMLALQLNVLRVPLPDGHSR